MTDQESSPDEPSRVSVEVLEEGPCKRRFKAEISAERVIEELDSSYRQLRGTVQLPGFRKGKVPRSYLEKKFGAQITEEVRDELMQDTFRDELQNHELRLVGDPNFENVEFERGQPFRFEASFEIAPSFEVPDYTALEIEAHPLRVEDHEVESEIQSIQEQSASLAELESGQQKEGDLAFGHVALREGDEVLIDRSDVFLKIGDDQVDNIPVEGLTGRLLEASADSEFRIPVQVPEDFPRDDLRGKKVDLSVEVRGFRRRELPELNAEFLSRFEVDTVDGLKDIIRKSFERRRRTEEENRQEEELVDRLVQTAEMDLPESVVENRTQQISANLRMRLAQEGKSEEEIEAAIAQDSTSAEEARKELKQFFLLEKIAEQEKVFVTEDEVARRITEIAYTYNLDPKAVFEDYRNRGGLPELRAGLMREKVRRTLREKAKVSGASDTEPAESQGPTEPDTESD